MNINVWKKPNGAKIDLNDFDFTEAKAKELGPHVEHHELFPNRINMQLLKVIDRNNIEIEKWYLCHFPPVSIFVKAVILSTAALWPGCSFFQ